MESVVSVQQLRLKRGSFELGPMDLELELGCALGLVGPSGAGKTSFIHCLLDLLRPDSGVAKLFGKLSQDKSWKQDLGFVLDQQVFYEQQSVLDNIEFMGKFYASYDRNFAKNLLTRLQLDANKKTKILSKGERIKLALACALSHRPKLLIADEASSGLDPLMRTEFFEILHELMRTGEMSILFSTHIMADVAAVADKLAFIKQGKLVKISSKDELLDNWRRISFCGAAANLPGEVERKSQGEQHIVTTKYGDECLASLKQSSVQVFDSNRLGIEEIAVHLLRGGKNV